MGPAHEPEPVLALHGFGGSPADFDAIASLAGTAPRLVAPALPGHGHPGAATAAAIRAPLEAREAAALAREWGREVIDALGTRSRGGVVLLGYSMGGRLGLFLALEFPRVFSRLVLVGASAGIADPVERAARREHDERWARLALASGSAAFFEAWERQPLLSPSRPPDPLLAASRRERRDRMDPVGLALALRALGPGSMPSVEDRLGELAIPVTWAAGADDTKYSRLAIELASRCRQGACEIIPGSGHAVHLEDPGACLRLLAKRSDHFP